MIILPGIGNSGARFYDIGPFVFKCGQDSMALSAETSICLKGGKRQHSITVVDTCGTPHGLVQRLVLAFGPPCGAAALAGRWRWGSAGAQKRQHDGRRRPPAGPALSAPHPHGGRLGGQPGGIGSVRRSGGQALRRAVSVRGGRAVRRPGGLAARRSVDPSAPLVCTLRRATSCSSHRKCNAGGVLRLLPCVEPRI